jgi:Fe-S-cluster containining protein
VTKPALKTVRNMSIDLDTGLLTAELDGGDGVVVDLLRRNPELHELSKRMAEVVKAKQLTGGEDNCVDCTGACCTGWSIGVTRFDAERMAEHLGVSLREVLKSYVDAYPAGELQGKTPYQMRHVKDTRYETGSRCVMLKVTEIDGNPQGRCSIYEARPDVCRAFSASNCEEFVPVRNLHRRLRGPVQK